MAQDRYYYKIIKIAVKNGDYQFINKKEFADFRKLGSSLKNINFILYDELLENLKNLRSKL